MVVVVVLVFTVLVIVLSVLLGVKGVLAEEAGVRPSTPPLRVYLLQRTLVLPIQAAVAADQAELLTQSQAEVALVVQDWW